MFPGLTPAWPQVLLDSPLANTMVNANLRHIYWPHYEGDPVVYWQKMGLAFVGGPQVINESQSMEIFNSPSEAQYWNRGGDRSPHN